MSFFQYNMRLRACITPVKLTLTKHNLVWHSSTSPSAAARVHECHHTRRMLLCMRSHNTCMHVSPPAPKKDASTYAHNNACCAEGSRLHCTLVQRRSKRGGRVCLLSPHRSITHADLHPSTPHTHRHAQRLRPDVEGILAASVVVLSAAARDLTCTWPAASPLALRLLDTF